MIYFSQSPMLPGTTSAGFRPPPTSAGDGTGTQMFLLQITRDQGTSDINLAAPLDVIQGGQVLATIVWPGGYFQPAVGSDVTFRANGPGAIGCISVVSPDSVR